MNFLICVAVFVSLRLDSDRDFVYIYINLHGSLEASACTYFNNVVRYFFFFRSVFGFFWFPFSPEVRFHCHQIYMCASIVRECVILYLDILSFEPYEQITLAFISIDACFFAFLSFILSGYWEKRKKMFANFALGQNFQFICSFCCVSSFFLCSNCVNLSSVK